VEHAIPSLVIGALLLVASAFIAHSSLQSYEQTALSLKAMQARMAEQSRTRLSIVSVTLDAERDTLDVNLKNDGQSRLALYSRFDVILDYRAAGVAASAWLPYEPTPPVAGAWSLISIEDDSFEPGLLNPGETALLRLELAAPLDAGETNRVVIVSETGAAVSAPFSS
jgi:archaellum component FlaF (FlaF/FlaG flagellin family)